MKKKNKIEWNNANRHNENQYQFSFDFRANMPLIHVERSFHLHAVHKLKAISIVFFSELFPYIKIVVKCVPWTNKQWPYSLMPYKIDWNAETGENERVRAITKENKMKEIERDREGGGEFRMDKNWRRMRKLKRTRMHGGEPLIH